MKVLVIDNHTGRIPDWEKLLLLNNFEKVDVVRIENFIYGDDSEYDLVVLTGATGLAIPTHFDEYKEEFKLILGRKKPILGVCVGFQAIVTAFGGKLLYREIEGIKGIIDMNSVANDQIFGDKIEFKVFESHKYYVSEVPTELITLAQSKYNIEVVKHILRPIYGFQFHPEVIDPQNDGSEIFKNFVEKIVK